MPAARGRCGSRRWPASSATNTKSLPPRTRFVTHVCLSTCADSPKPARAATPRTARSTDRGVRRSPCGPTNSACRPPAPSISPLRLAIHTSSAARHGRFNGTSRYTSPFPERITSSPLRAEIDTSSTSSATSSCSRSPVYSSSVTIARSLGREASAARSSERCCSSDSARGAACASGSRLTFAGPSPRNRLIHRRGLPAPLGLQVALEVPCRVISPPRIQDREPRLGASGQPGSIRADMLTVRIPRPGRQRRPLQIPQIPLHSAVDVTDRTAALVSRRRFPPL
jgi:hypothetical protein